MFSATVITLFPEMFPGPLGCSLAGSALKDGIWKLETLNLRPFGIGKHQVVDDSPYGGGAGMVLKPDVIDAAIMAAKAASPEAQLVYMTPRGQHITQPLLSQLIEKPIIILCGRYEAVDERALQKHQPLELSLGDYVLSGGEIAAMALLDGCVRLLPGVIGDPESLAEESFGLHQDYAGLLEHPHYTKPPVWEGVSVPEVLVSGDHAKVRAWRLQQSEEMTRSKRPDLWSACAAKKLGKKQG